MKPIRVAVVHSVAPWNLDSGRRVGQWSYPVPEFEWVDVRVGKHFSLDKDEAARGCDVIFHEGQGSYGTFEGNAHIPVCSWICDSYFGAKEFRRKLGQVRHHADLILVDLDRLERFEGLGIPVRRMSHSVNDLLHRDYGIGKPVDVGFYAGLVGKHPIHRFAYWRTSFWTYVQEFCERRGYVADGGPKPPGVEYARAISRTKVALHLPGAIVYRGHRVFDVIASRTCLLTYTVEPVSGEDVRRGGVHYVEFATQREAEDKIDWLLETGKWKGFADAGYGLIQERHIWRVRAGQLRQTLLDVFPRLKERVA